jgi:preprotein translocase subunit YajC
MAGDGAKVQLCGWVQQLEELGSGVMFLIIMMMMMMRRRRRRRKCIVK